MLVSPKFWIIIIFLLVTLLYLIRKGRREAAQFTLTRKELLLSPCPEALAGLRILHLSDLHFRSGSQLASRLMPLIEAAQPELIFLTGDLLMRGGRGNGLKEAEDFLRALVGRGPTYLVLGNEDFHKGEPHPGEQWRAIGTNLLINQSLPYQRARGRLWITGVDDPHEGHPDLAGAAQDLPPGEPALLLAHSPVIIRQPGIERFSVIFAGHTHGGQICLPGGKALHIHTRLPLRYSQGLHRLEGKDNFLIVSRGAGVTRVGLRLNCPPELTLWTISRETAAEAI